jgi:membrane protease YdiL (CAAX protease family)
MASIQASFISTALFFPFMLVTNLIPEELGWRGYLLDKLQMQMNPLTSSIIMGVIWCFWHGPLFFITAISLSQYEVSQILPHYIFLFLLQVIGLSIYMTYLYNASGRSTFIAILAHGVVNSSISIFFGFLGVEEIASMPTDMLGHFNTAFTLFIILQVLLSLVFVITTNGRLGYKDNMALDQNHK